VHNEDAKITKVHEAGKFEMTTLRAMAHALVALVVAFVSLDAVAAAADLPGGSSRPALVSGAAGPLPGDSIYHLSLALTDQDGKNFHLVDRRGKPQLVSMFYTSCPYVCPLVIDTLKKTQNELSPAESAQLQVLLVSFDPERDTAQRLKETFDERKVDARAWTMARTEARGVRKLAATLGIQYRELANREINHSVALVLLDGDGRIAAKTDKFGVVDPDFVAEVHKLLAPR
jgi:protein SCO1/2